MNFIKFVAQPEQNVCDFINKYNFDVVNITQTIQSIGYGNVVVTVIWHKYNNISVPSELEKLPNTSGLVWFKGKRYGPENDKWSELTSDGVSHFVHTNTEFKIFK